MRCRIIRLVTNKFSFLLTTSIAATIGFVTLRFDLFRSGCRKTASGEAKSRMNTLGFLLTIGLALCDGMALGFASGFALQANASATEGVDVPFDNVAVRFLFRRANNLNMISGVMYLALIAIVFPLLIALLVLPFVVATLFALPGAPFVWGSVLGAMVVGMVLGKFVGAWWFNRLLDS